LKHPKSEPEVVPSCIEMKENISCETEEAKSWLQVEQQ
jgi:hypothetical protein